MGGTDIPPSPPSVQVNLPKRPWLLWGASLALVLSGVWWTRLSWLPELGTQLNVSDPLSYAPAVLILPGSEETRPFVAAGLMRAGFADRVLVPETRANSDVRSGVHRSTLETTQQILIRRGIPTEKIVTLTGDSDSTIGDAEALERYFQQSGVTDVIIVTNAYHSRRARWAFRHVLPEHQHRLRFYSAPNGFDDRIWWTSRNGRESVLSEWLKFAFYVMYHGHGWLWCVVLAMLGGTITFTRRHRKQGTDHDGICTPPPANR